MSRMLEALKQIEAKRARPQPPANMSPVEDRPAACAPVQTLTEVESETPSDALDSYDTELTELHPLIQEELNELRPSPVLIKEPISGPPNVQSAASDSFAINKTLARAESAVTSALSPEEPDIYEEMAQYILVQLTPGRSAALLFTSPGDIAGQTETLFSLSKTLVDHYHQEVLVLDANFRHPDFSRRLPNKGGMRYEKMPNISGDWGHLLEELKTRYQLVLIDAPSLAHAQTAPMISQCDGVYLVIPLGYTTPRDVRRSVSVIQQAGGRLLGSIAIGEAVGIGLKADCRLLKAQVIAPSGSSGW